MNIQMIRSCMHNFEEAIFLGKEMEVAGTLILVAAITREEKTVQIYLFAEGEDTRALQEMRAKTAKKRQRGTLTKREELLAELGERGICLLDLVRGIRVAGKEYGFGQEMEADWKNTIWKEGCYCTSFYIIMFLLDFWKNRISP